MTFAEGPPLRLRPTPRTDVEPRQERGPSGLPGPVVLGVVDADLAILRPAMVFAVREAQERRVPLVVLHAYGEPHEQTAPGDERARARRTKAVVGRATQEVRRLAHDTTVVLGLRSCRTATAALVAGSCLSSLVVLQVRPGRHPHQVGTTVAEVVRHAACPVAVLHEADVFPRGGGIVVGIRTAGRMQTCLRVAVGEALRSFVRLTVVHAWQVPASPSTASEWRLAQEAAEQLLDQALGGVLEQFPMLELSRRAVRGPAADVLRACAEDADLLVVARPGGVPLESHRLGAIVPPLLERAPCPVVVTPPYGSPYRDADPRLLDLIDALGPER